MKEFNRLSLAASTMALALCLNTVSGAVIVPDPGGAGGTPSCAPPYTTLTDVYVTAYDAAGCIAPNYHRQDYYFTPHQDTKGREYFSNDGQQTPAGCSGYQAPVYPSGSCLP